MTKVGLENIEEKIVSYSAIEWDYTKLTEYIDLYSLIFFISKNNITKQEIQEIIETLFEVRIYIGL